jgi:hypothetical protein
LRVEGKPASVKKKQMLRGAQHDGRAFSKNREGAHGGLGQSIQAAGKQWL